MADFISFDVNRNKALAECGLKRDPSKQNLVLDGLVLINFTDGNLPQNNTKPPNYHIADWSQQQDANRKYLQFWDSDVMEYFIVVKWRSTFIVTERYEI